jgi:hypothetical protein
MEREQVDAIVRILDELSPADRATLRSFAEFLLQRAGGVAEAAVIESHQPVPAPRDVPRPENERVVAAVKRLSNTYFMLDKAAMLGATSDLVTQHVVQGREAAEVIDKLETLFADHYRALQQDKG